MKFKEAEKVTKSTRARWDEQWALMRKDGSPKSAQEFSEARKAWVHAVEAEVAAFEAEYMQGK